MNEQRISDPLVKAGDTVFHRPSGEIWLVAAISENGKDLAWAGWPEGFAHVADCELRKSCSDEESRAMTRRLLNCRRDNGSFDIRARWAQATLNTWPELALGAGI